MGTMASTLAHEINQPVAAIRSFADNASLFLERGDTPSEDDQYATYSGMLKALGGRPLIVRTLDIGGDKQVPYLNLPHEENPFLGIRGSRLMLRRPDLLEPQLRAHEDMLRQLLLRVPNVLVMNAASAAQLKIHSVADLIAYLASDRAAAIHGAEFVIDGVATNIGLNYNRIVLVVTSLLSLAAGVVTVVVGNLPFLGLIVPNLVSLSMGDNLRKSLPYVAAAGAGGRPVNVTFNVSTPDVAGFRRSQGQIAASLGRALARGERNA